MSEYEYNPGDLFRNYMQEGYNETFREYHKRDTGRYFRYSKKFDHRDPVLFHYVRMLYKEYDLIMFYVKRLRDLAIMKMRQLRRRRLEVLGNYREVTRNVRARRA